MVVNVTFRLKFPKLRPRGEFLRRYLLPNKVEISLQDMNTEELVLKKFLSPQTLNSCTESGVNCYALYENWNLIAVYVLVMDIDK